MINKKYFKNKNVIITGGLGFLGSNLAHELINLEANVTIIDNLNTLYGGNLYNIRGIEDKVRVIVDDVRNIDTLMPYIENANVIFHFAAQVSYIDSLSMPYEDLDLNAKSTLILLEALRLKNPKCKLVFASSRMVLGKIETPLMSENTPTNPLSLYGIHKLTSEKYLQMYYKDFGIPFVVLRITNPYGIRQQMKHSKYSLVGWFIRQAMQKQTIKIYGDGKQLRDYIFSEDITNGFINCAACVAAEGKIFNLGSGQSTEFGNMVNCVLNTVGTGHLEYVPWPNDYEKIETGDVRTDIGAIQKITNWDPKISLEDGINRTYEYIKENANHYF